MPYTQDVASLFLFGAGASAFSGECDPQPPPLGNHLFQALRARGGSPTQLVDDEHAAIFERNFEEGMELFRERHEEHLSAFLRDMAAYFADFAPGASNAYVSLISGLTKLRRHITLATLNYDVLIELAINLVGFGVNYGMLKSDKAVQVLKLHGSCNFLPELYGSTFRNVTFVGGLDGALGGADVRAVTPGEAKEFCAREDSVAPVLALYAAGKPVLYCPEFVREQQRTWREEVRRAARIYLVGVRVNPADAHIWDPLAEGRTPLYYVDPRPGEFLAWAKVCRRPHAVHFAETFQDAIDPIIRQHGR